MKKASVLVCFLMSLALHSIIGLFFHLMSSTSILKPFEAKDQQKTFVSFVSDEQIPEKYLLKNKKSSKVWLSKTKKRVKKQTTKKMTLFKNKNFLAQSTPINQYKKDEIFKKFKKLEKKIQKVKAKNRGPSSLSDYIKNIPTGSLTALDTDPITFYSFLQRAGDKIKPRWLGYLQDIPMDFFFRKDTVKVTIAKLILDDQGRFLKVILERPSGIPLIDQAALEALKQASPLPNPPKELIKEDNLIYLTYKFHVVWKN